MQEIKFKAALFDLDGVVFDTEPQYSVFWGMICRQYHPEHPGLEHEIKGSTLVQIYDRWFSGPDQGVPGDTDDISFPRKQSTVALCRTRRHRDRIAPL